MQNMRTMAMAGMLCGATCWCSITVRAQEVQPQPASSTEQEGASTAPAKANNLATLTAEQQQLAAKYKRFEEVLLRLAELTAGEDPERAALLRKAVSQSKDRLIGLQYERLIEILEQDRLANAITNQGTIATDLNALLELLLSEDRAKKIDEEKKQLEAYIKEVNELIKTQKSLQAQTEGRGDPQKLAEQEGSLADRTGKLAGDMKSTGEAAKPNEAESQEGTPGSKPGEGPMPDEEERPGAPPAGDASGEPKESGKPSSPMGDQGEPQEGQSGEPQEGASGQPQEGQQGQQGQQGEQGEQGESPPSGQQPSSEQQQKTAPAQERLQAAQEKMREAQKKLDEAKRSDARDKQEEALAELERAKAELEEILRQLREEEQKRMLAMLEARFRAMLAEQIEIYEGTLRLDRTPEQARSRGFEIESGRLSRRESVLSGEAEKTLHLLTEEGSAVAMPEAVMQMRDDMEQVVVRLGGAKVDELTQGIEEDIIAALEEMLAAIKKAQQEQEQKQSQPPPPAGEPGEPPLIDKIAELKMIRSLQLRVNKRTERYSKLVDEEGQTEQAELLEALLDLAAREQRIHKATRDIAVGRNQ
ncbi:MAG: hypothetical protein KF708_05155 [Pirellulales bacterium]|nr:hypothetical protein [Pirellulales bacterium]